MRRIVFLLFIFFLGCKDVEEIEVKQTAGSISDLFQEILLMCRTSNTNMLNAYLSKNFSYSILDERDDYNRKMVIDNFDFLFFSNLIIDGIFADKHFPEEYAYSPPREHYEGYMVYFEKSEDSKGWKIKSIDLVD